MIGILFHLTNVEHSQKMHSRRHKNEINNCYTDNITSNIISTMHSFSISMDRPLYYTSICYMLV